MTHGTITACMDTYERTGNEQQEVRKHEKHNRVFIRGDN